MEPYSEPQTWIEVWPEMESDDFKERVSRLVSIQTAKRDLLQGDISFEEFEEILFDFKIEPDIAHQGWNSGLRLVL